MDVFIEQLISAKRTGKDNLKLAAIVLGFFVLASVLLFVFLFYSSPFIAAIIFLVLYFAFKVIGMQSTEYEYIMTNGTLDVDKIMGKAKRERIVSINCSKIDAAGEYNPNAHISASFNKKFVCCNPEDKAYYIVANDKDKGKVCIVIAPNGKMSEALNKYVPRTVAYNLFKGE